MRSFTDGEVAVKHHESWGFENHNRDRVSDRRCDLHVKPSLDELASHPSSNGRSICDDEDACAFPLVRGEILLLRQRPEPCSDAND